VGRSMGDEAALSPTLAGFPRQALSFVHRPAHHKPYPILWTAPCARGDTGREHGDTTCQHSPTTTLATKEHTTQMSLKAGGNLSSGSKKRQGLTRPFEETRGTSGGDTYGKRPKATATEMLSPEFHHPGGAEKLYCNSTLDKRGAIPHRKLLGGSNRQALNSQCRERSCHESLWSTPPDNVCGTHKVKNECTPGKNRGRSLETKGTNHSIGGTTKPTEDEHASTAEGGATSLGQHNQSETLKDAAQANSVAVHLTQPSETKQTSQGEDVHGKQVVLSPEPHHQGGAGKLYWSFTLDKRGAIPHRKSLGGSHHQALNSQCRRWSHQEPLCPTQPDNRSGTHRIIRMEVAKLCDLQRSEDRIKERESEADPIGWQTGGPQPLHHKSSFNSHPITPHTSRTNGTDHTARSPQVQRIVSSKARPT